MVANKYLYSSQGTSKLRKRQACDTFIILTKADSLCKLDDLAISLSERGNGTVP